MPAKASPIPSAGHLRSLRVPRRSPAASASAVRRVAAAGLCTWLSGCSQYPESEYPKAPPPGVNVSEADVAPAAPGTLWRSDVNAALDAGLGRFLQRVELVPQVHEGNFVGFRIVELRPPSWWQGVDLFPGDVVTRVNGMPIEQPTEAHAAFESLRNADKLTVTYLRDDKERELSYSIVKR